MPLNVKGTEDATIGRKVEETTIKKEDHVKKRKKKVEHHSQNCNEH